MLRCGGRGLSVGRGLLGLGSDGGGGLSHCSDGGRLCCTTLFVGLVFAICFAIACVSFFVAFVIRVAHLFVILAREWRFGGRFRGLATHFIMTIVTIWFAAIAQPIFSNALLFGPALHSDFTHFGWSAVEGTGGGFGGTGGRSFSHRACACRLASLELVPVALFL